MNLICKSVEEDSTAPKTDDIELCGNCGCVFNNEGKCTASGTECFGYIEVVN